ncbi:MAG: DegT/DnrJ/EryC1/StrS family aminotransferase [Armatimonadetes bacterium]|nr:DegT/DnrJ/EryC1/StrS family aminotransferase [Armatimonadota bacterium]
MNKANSGRRCAPVVEIPLIDLRQQHRALQHKIYAALRHVFDSSVFVMGPNVRSFEAEMTRFLDVKHAIGVASGTDALNLSLDALGIKPGDEVLVPSFTYAATAAAVCHLGATPVFADSLPDGFNLDPADAARRITPKTKAIIPVHLYGEAAPMDEIMELARAHDLYIVEDVAQAVGGFWKERRLGSLGDTGCFSFYPTKNLAACGDAGMVVTNDDELAKRVRLLRQQADASVIGGEKYTHPAVGYNSRLDEIQAAILRVKLPHLDSWNALRQQHSQRYRMRLKDSGLALPEPRRDGSHVYCLYTIRCERREELRAWLRDHRIGFGAYYPLPLHLQEAYRGLGYREGDLPNAERLSRECLSIPIYPELTADQVDQVADVIQEFVGNRAAIEEGETVSHEL